MTLRRGDTVTYTLKPGLDVESLVKTVHHDGSVTIQARFFYEAGQRRPGFLGYHYRVDSKVLTLTRKRER